MDIEQIYIYIYIYIHIAAMEMTIVAGICKTNIYRNGCYLRLFGKRQWQSSQISH